MAIFDNTAFYKEAIDEHGQSAQGVHWSSKYTQYKRFDVLTHFIRKKISDSSIVDIGCGFAEYFHYLQQNNQMPLFYTGIDCEEVMVKACLKRFPYLEFLRKNALNEPLPRADYYICSGAMNILDDHEFFIFITNCYTTSKKGFVFNCLTKDSFNDIPKQRILEFARILSDDVKIKEGYLYNDMTVFMKKT